MNELEIWKTLPQKGQMYIYDDYEKLAIRLYITKGVIMCNFKRKGKQRNWGTSLLLLLEKAFVTERK